MRLQRWHHGWITNSLIEIGSKANVILRFKAPISINGQSYVADEPYLFLKDVNVVCLIILTMIKLGYK